MNSTPPSFPDVQERCFEEIERAMPGNRTPSLQAWLPDGYRQILKLYVFGPSGFWTMAPLRYAAKFDPFLSLDCALHPGTIQGKEGIKFCHLATLAAAAHPRPLRDARPGGAGGDRGQCCQMAKFDPFLSLDCARVEGAIQGKEGIKFCSTA